MAITCGPFRPDYHLSRGPFCGHDTACFSWGAVSFAAPWYLDPTFHFNGRKISLQRSIAFFGF